MAHSLGKRVVGEGVDNSLQSLWLQELGCDQLQGHILAAPIGECDLLSKLAPFYQHPRVNTLDSAR
jgi:EAL domain-containing protein (putative c-di-GMP-specific phosphodiesterase class I)